MSQNPRTNDIAITHSQGATEAPPSNWLRRRWNWSVTSRPTQSESVQNLRMLAASAFAVVAERELRGSLRRKRLVSLAVFDLRHLKKVVEHHGTEVGQALTAKVIARLAALAGSEGAVALTAPDQYTVLLPGVDRLGALQAVHRVMGNPARVQVEVGGAPVVLAPAFEVECATHNESIMALQRELARDLQSETPQKVQPDVPKEVPAPVRKSVVVWPDDPAVELAFATRAAFPATVPMGLTAAT